MTASPSYPREDVRLSSQDKTIALTVWRAHPDAVTMLFCPSTMASPLLHEFFLLELRRLGCNAVGLHPVGHGLARHVQQVFRFEDVVRNGLDAADWIRAHFRGPLVVTGHSQGGIQALAHAVRDTHLAAAMPVCTLIPTHPQAPLVTRFGGLLRWREQIVRAVAGCAALLPWVPVFMPMYLSIRRVSHGADHPRFNSACLRASYPLAFVDSLFRAEVGMVRDGRTDYTVHCPFFLFTACNDALFPLDLMHTMLDVINAPHKELHVLQGGGHTAPFSRRYATQLAACMAEQCARLGLPLFQTSGKVI